MRPATETVWRHDSSFNRLVIGRRVLLIHRDILPHADAIVAQLGELPGARVPGAGNRQSAHQLSLEGGPLLVARRARRGGMVRLLLSDTFFGLDPRPFRELRVAIEARRRGIAVAEPMGAMVQWLGLGLYRGFFLTRALAGMTLWDFVRTDEDPAVRNHVMLKARAAVATMHDRGLFHADLNLQNLFVTRQGESFAVVILDLDKARMYDGPLAARMRRSNARRLVRSARKLDPAGRYFDMRALSILNVG
ncbi:MAG TPA: lipopolysaccharide kinase InaA family protein [Candidatus Binataceae bacterium]|nr:lipopolysaccharide kinase InaA family protein [Candidatus Binataceae bacterium]